MIIDQFPLIFGVIGICFLITIHELGHFLFCKLFKIPAPKFAIGVGPKLYEKKIGETDFSIGLFPFAGYVQIGENSQQEDLNVLKKNKFYKGAMVLLGGIIFNILFAYITITTVLFFEVKNNSALRPFISNTRVSKFEFKDDSENKDLFKSNDLILSVNNKFISIPLEVLENCGSCKKDEFIDVLIERDSEKLNLKIKNEDGLNKIFLNAFENYNPNFSFLEKIKMGISVTNNLFIATIKGIISLFKKFNTKNMCGFLGIIGSTASAFKSGFLEFMAFLSIISINLAIMNLIPLPMLDGGQLLMLAFNKITGKDISDKVQTFLFYFSFIIIAGIMLVSTFNDILRFFKW